MSQTKDYGDERVNERGFRTIIRQGRTFSVLPMHDATQPYTLMGVKGACYTLLPEGDGIHLRAKEINWIFHLTCDGFLKAGLMPAYADVEPTPVAEPVAAATVAQPVISVYLPCWQDWVDWTPAIAEPTPTVSDEQIDFSLQLGEIETAPKTEKPAEQVKSQLPVQVEDCVLRPALNWRIIVPLDGQGQGGQIEIGKDRLVRQYYLNRLKFPNYSQFTLTKVDEKETYWIYLSCLPKMSHCSCKGFMRWRHCKHVTVLTEMSKKNLI